MNSVVSFFRFPFSKTLVGVRPPGGKPFGPPWGFSCSKVLGIHNIVQGVELDPASDFDVEVDDGAVL